MTTEILTRKESAEHMKLSIPTMDRMRVNGDGPKFVKIGASVRYRKADLDEWIASRLVRSTSQAA